MLHGRLTERRLLASFIDEVREGAGTALVLVGEAGVGKTRLLNDTALAAEDIRVSWTSGAEAESHLGFAGLHRLLRPFLDRLDRLPAPQRSALSTAFGLDVGSPPDLFLVGLAALTLLADVAEEAPLVCLVDDAQWLDPESLAALAFLGRRLGADGIGLLIAARDEPKALQGLRTHTVAGLADDDARLLVASRVESRLDPQVAKRIVLDSGGNPLALIEATAALSTEQLAGGSVLPEHLPIGRRLDAHFVGQVRAMPPETRLLLLLIAAAPGDDQALLWSAAAHLRLDPAALDTAIAAGVVLPTYTFRHPLIRSAVYRAAPPADRRAVHAALGEAAGKEESPETRAWHLAESVVGLDDAVADELEEASERARARGGYAAQATYLSRSAELTTDPQRRAVRFLASTRPYLIIADTASAARRLDQATPGLTLPPLRAAAQRARAGVDWYSTGVASRAPSILLDALDSFGPLDADTTRAMLWEAMTAGLLAGRYTEGVTLLDVASMAKNAPPRRPGPPTMADLLLEPYALRISDQYALAVPPLRNAVATMGSENLSDGNEPLAAVGAWAALDLWDDEGFGAVLTRMDTHARSQGALHALVATLVTETVWKTLTGDFAEAAAHNSEAARIGEAIGVPLAGLATRIGLLAWQGDEDLTRSAAETTRRIGEEARDGAGRNHVQYALTTLELGLGRYPEALAVARQVVADDMIGDGNRILADAVEAGVRADDRAFAERAFARLSERAPLSGTPWALGLLARARALLADDDTAGASYQESVDLLARTSVRTDLARSHLLHGEWLRRLGRRVDARDQLRTAHEMFADMGAAAFARRAELELRATGENLRKRSAQPDVGLTPQELQVARLAIEGATNAEIATRLFVTASTVEYHLNKIFRKLGITSRRQLAGVLRS